MGNDKVAAVEVCVIRGCSWDGRGTAGGSPPVPCGGYGCPPGGLMAHYASWDPEDRPPYPDEAAT